MRSSSIVLAVSLLQGYCISEVRGHEGAGVRDYPQPSNYSRATAPLYPRTTDSLTTDSLTIVLTGDILLDRGVRQTIERYGASHLFSDGVDSVFQSAQVVVGNLECPATKIKSPAFKRFIFRGEPEWLDSLRQHGITHLNLANKTSPTTTPSIRGARD